MKTGTIILLNGTSSSGKSSLIRGLQDELAEPYLEFGLDKFIWMLPKRYFRQPLWNNVLGKADQAGEYGHQLVRGMHRAVKTLAVGGLNLLVDHVLVEPAWVFDCAEQLHALKAYLIGVRCNLQILEQRERDRDDRTLGQARAQFNKVHRHGCYDFEVDSGKYSPRENIMQIITFLESGQAPSALYQLNAQKPPRQT